MNRWYLSLLLILPCVAAAQDLVLRSNTGHATLGISSAVFSPNEKYVASVAQDGIKLWDLESGKELNTWKSKNFLRNLLFTPDSKFLLAFSVTDSLTTIDIRTGNSRAVKIPRQFFTDVKLSPDGKIIALFSNGSIVLWDLEKNTMIHEITIDKSIPEISFSTDSKTLRFTRFDDLSAALSVSDGKPRYGHLKPEKAITAVRHAANSDKVLVLNTDYTVDLWDLGKAIKIKTLSQPNFAWTAFDISPQGDYAIIGGTLDNQARIISLTDFKEVTLPAHTGEVRVVRFSPSGKYVLTNSMANGTIRIWNPRTGDEVVTLRGAEDQAKLAYSSRQFLVLKNQSSVKVWNIRQNNIQLYPLDSTVLSTQVVSEKQIYTIKKMNRDANPTYALFNLATGRELSRFRLEEGFELDQKAQFLVSPNEKLLLVTKLNGTFQPIQWIDIPTGATTHVMRSKFIPWGNDLSRQIQFLDDGKHLIFFGSRSAKIKSVLLDYDHQVTLQFEVDDLVRHALAGDQLYVASFEGISVVNLLTGKTTRVKSESLNSRSWRPGSAFYFQSGIAIAPSRSLIALGQPGLSLYHLPDDRLDKIPGAHLAPINYLNFIAHDSILVSSSIDGQIKFWDVIAQKEILELRNPAGAEWMVKTPDGLFDASPTQFRDLYFVRDQEVIELEQMKSRFYEPHLLQKKLGYSTEVIRKTNGLGQMNMYPAIKLGNPDSDPGVLRITLSDQGGGFGKVTVKINNKEVAADVRNQKVTETDSTLVIDYRITNHPFLLPHGVNQIEVIAFNKEEYLQSRPKRYTYITDNKKDEAADLRVFGLFVGVSNYSGQELDLKYASGDAISLSQSIGWSAEKQFGANNTFITSLTSDAPPDRQPGKENIRRFFETTARTARPQDILIIFLAGHGVNFGGEDGDFYFLTAEASSGDIKDPFVRKTTAISSQELTDYIKLVPCLKQVLVLDACHAGQYANDLLASARSEKPASEVRALERLKDRTGLYVLSGAAADAVSYEASTYGQGLLTYSLLFGVKGAALRDNKYVDVMNLFQFAADEVPRLAESIGGIQKPEIRVPYGARSFDIGIMDESIQARIKLPSPKPLFIRSNYSNDETFNDEARLSEKTDEFLMGQQARDGSVVFVNVGRFPNAYALRGRYTHSGKEYRVQSKLYKGEQLLYSFETRGEEPNSVIEKISSEVEDFLKRH
ncbi:MAG TPA: caspase family protein [Cyclobacteriaceae bacterium]|nr:caspase family protein [Cyclobacteriaceae bacterium]